MRTREATGRSWLRRGLPGLLVLAAVAFFFWFNRGLTLWNGRHVGPGMVPLAITLMMLVAGVAILLEDRVKPLPEPDDTPVVPWRSVVLITGGIVLFAALIRPFGMVPACGQLVLAAALAAPEARLVEAVLLTLCLVAFVWAVFILGLGLPIPLIDWPGRV